MPLGECEHVSLPSLRRGGQPTVGLKKSNGKPLLTQHRSEGELATENYTRASEIELARLGLSSFRTPAASAWAGIIEKCTNHLHLDGTAATLPHANQIWMLFGFELFACLKSGLRAEVIEVYPFAIIRALLPVCKHKSTE
jgi:hypothetical protein